jgi:hypothetical protein
MVGGSALPVAGLRFRPLTSTLCPTCKDSNVNICMLRFMLAVACTCCAVAGGGGGGLNRSLLSTYMLVIKQEGMHKPSSTDKVTRHQQQRRIVI